MSDTKLEKKLKIVGHGNKDAKKTEIVCETDGKQWTGYAWNNSIEKKPGDFAVGVEATFVIENKPYQDKPQYMLLWQKNSGGRGGGVAKSDPAKNAIIQQANANNNATMAKASALKNSVACFQMAVALLGEGADVNAVRATASDISQGVMELAAIFGAKGGA